MFWKISNSMIVPSTVWSFYDCGNCPISYFMFFHIIPSARLSLEVECTLHYPGLYAGQTDMCGIYQGRESIIDFKQSNKPKKAEWIDDYKLQLVAYAMAHDQVYGTRIEQGVILMCTPDNFFQRFIVNGSEFREWKWEWLRRIDTYYGRNVAKS